MSTFVAKRLTQNVHVSELLRQAVATSPRLLPGALLPLLVLWAPALLGTVAAVSVFDGQWLVVAVLSALTLYSLVIAPILAASLVGPALRIGAGGRVPAAEVGRGGLMPAGALGAALLAGLATGAGYALCVLPAYFVGALWFVAGPVARVEGGGVGAVLSRTSQLTRDNRLMLAGVSFLIMFLEGVLFRLALFFEKLDDVPAALTVACLMILPTTLLRAVASAAAYNQLRVAKEGLEVDELARQLGGVEHSTDHLALSEREIAALGRRRGFIARLSGSAAEEGEADAMASVRDMDRVARDRKLRLRVVGGVVVALVVLGTGGAVAMGVLNRVAENRRIDAAEESVRQAHAAGEGHAGTRVSREIAGHVMGARGERRREVLGRLMAIHADSYYGQGFAEAFAELGEDASDDELLPALRIALSAAGCDGAVEAARSEENPSKAFAKRCPAGEAAPLHLSRFRKSSRLGHAVFAELLEMRARERRIESEPLHEISVQLLLPER